MEAFCGKGRMTVQSPLYTTITPSTGQMAIVRERPAVFTEVQPSPAGVNQPLTHLVQVEYLDGHRFPETQTLVWEREQEVGARIFSRLDFPDITTAGCDRPEQFSAFIDALRWTSLARLEDAPGGDPGLRRVLAPWFGSVQIEDYQLYPVLKALDMPRITLLLADDVGLGKTIEAGLIARELIARRRIRRILVVCPASLQVQWREEMRDKFHLPFTILDRSEALRIQRELGVDANPWATTPRMITSMDYLRQPDVRAQFESAVQAMTVSGQPSLPWDLLIVDEAHNLAPQLFGRVSQRYEMLQQIAAEFEHRLFLTATPHNGHTSSFTGLLQLLDPVRFDRRSELDPQYRQQIKVAVVRRLKADIDRSSLVKRFAQREVKSLPVELTPSELELWRALRAYRHEALQLLRDRGNAAEMNLGRFLFSLLVKRLLSSSYAFARTWWAHVAGYEPGEDETDGEVLTNAAYARDLAETIVEDDAEKDRREEDAVRLGGGWLGRLTGALREQVASVNQALEALGWARDTVLDGEQDGVPDVPDARWQALLAWLERHLQTKDGGLRADERLILFTEYKHTLDYLTFRLHRRGLMQPEVVTLFGGAPSSLREHVKAQFGDPDSPVRILAATDTASEGLNLQASCRYVIHQEVPWNPMRLEQRNGRVDRHGQPRDVRVWHFVCRNDDESRFLDYIVGKVETIRGDLGSAGEVIDRAVERHFTDEPRTSSDFDRKLDEILAGSSHTDIELRDSGGQEAHEQALQRLRAAELELGLSGEGLARLLRQAVKLEGGSLDVDPALPECNGVRAYRLREPVSWGPLVKETLLIQRGPQRGARPALVFDPAYFEAEADGRRLYRPRTDTVLLRLGHPLLRRALAVLRKQMWPSSGTEKGLERWTVAGARLPVGMEAVVFAHILLTAVNDLRETVHAELVTCGFEIRRDRLIPLRPELEREVAALEQSELGQAALADWISRLRQVWVDHEGGLGRIVQSEKETWTARLEAEAARALSREKAGQEELYNQRLQELARRDLDKERKRRLRELEKAKVQAQQRALFEDENRRLEEELERAKRRLRDIDLQRDLDERSRLRDRLQREKKRLLEDVLPRRYSLRQVDLQPVALQFLVRPLGHGGGGPHAW